MTAADRQGDERFADWVDGRMGERERERFVAELRVNAQLRADLAAYERTVAAVRAALQAPTRPVAMADRVRAALAAAPAAPAAADKPTLRLLPRVFWSLGTAAAALLAALWLDAWSGGDRAPTAEQAQVVARRDRAEPTGGLRGSDLAAGRGEADAKAAADGAPAADPAAAAPAAAVAPRALAVGNAASAPQEIAQPDRVPSAAADAQAATASPRPGEPPPGAVASSKDLPPAPGGQTASDDVALGAARAVGGGGAAPAAAPPAARAAAKAAPAPAPIPLLVLDVAAPPAGGSESADAARKPAPAGASPLDAAALRAAVRAFLATAVAEDGAAMASWPTAAGVLQLSPWLDDPASAADGSVRSWVVEGDKADVAALLAVAAEFARDRAGSVQNGEIPVALPAVPPAENRVAPSARLVLRLKLRRR